MANHPTAAQSSVIQAKTVGACKPSELQQIMDQLSRIPYVNATDGNASAGESTITTLLSGKSV